jgi:hypothetical protein
LGFLVDTTSIAVRRAGEYMAGRIVQSYRQTAFLTDEPTGLDEPRPYFQRPGSVEVLCKLDGIAFLLRGSSHRWHQHGLGRKGRDQTRMPENVETMPPCAHRHDPGRAVASSEAVAAWVGATPAGPVGVAKGSAEAVPRATISTVRDSRARASGSPRRSSEAHCSSSSVATISVPPGPAPARLAMHNARQAPGEPVLGRQPDRAARDGGTTKAVARDPPRNALLADCRAPRPAGRMPHVPMQRRSARSGAAASPDGSRA